MWGHFIPPLVVVNLHGTNGVDWVTLVRVYGDTEEARVGLIFLLEIF
jgi:hypothetical protein